MKVNRILWIVGILIVFSACEVEIEPTLTITVVDSANVPLSNAYVITDPCLDREDCDTDRVNINFIKESFTNELGKVTFKYPYSAIIDVQAQWTADTSLGYYEFEGETVARFETKRTTDANESNEYSVVLEVQKIIK